MADNTIRVEGNYGANFLSIHSGMQKDQYLPDLYRTYGRGFDILDFLWMPSRAGLVKNRTVKLWEEGNIKANITTSTAITTGAVGADITFKIGAGDYDANGNPAVRVYQTVYIPQAYQPAAVNVRQNYQVVSRSGSAGDYTFTARPFNSGVARIATEVPIGTVLSLGPLQFAPGTGAPTGTTQATFERSFKTTILKEHIGWEGGFLSHQNWEPIYNGGKLMGYYNKALLDTEFLLDDQLNEYIFSGQENDNAALVQTSNFSGSQKVLSGTGIWNSLDASGQQLWYTDAFVNGDYVTAKNLLESQGVMDTDVIFAMGSELYDDTDQADLDYLKEYSGGSDLLKNMTELGFQAQVVNRNGVRFNKVKLKSFSNPFTMGNDAYDLSSSGFMMPTTKAKVKTADGKSVRLNNVSLHFLGYGGEDRTRVVGTLAGMNGFQGFNPVNANDGMTVEMLTEPMLVFTNINQCIQVRKE